MAPSPVCPRCAHQLRTIKLTCTPSTPFVTATTANSLPQLPQKAIAVSPATDAQAHLNHVEPDEAEPEREITDEERMKRTSQAERRGA